MAKSIVILGTQWGDEGKGKVVDLLTEKFDTIVRYNGGANAGHEAGEAGLQGVRPVAHRPGGGGDHLGGVVVAVVRGRVAIATAGRGVDVV